MIFGTRNRDLVQGIAEGAGKHGCSKTAPDNEGS
jgi:hypothetical protein